MKIAAALILTILATGLAHAQDSSTEGAAIDGQPAIVKQEFTPAPKVFQPKVAKYDYDAIPRDPLASAIFSATIPGSGQVYNKEYLRGILTAVLFYGGFFTAQYELIRWQQINMDTIYFNETNEVGTPTGQVRAVYVPKSDKDQIGLPTGEKVILGTAIAAAAASYVFGIVDSYKGAKRYNRKLIESASLLPKPYFAFGERTEAGVVMKF